MLLLAALYLTFLKWLLLCVSLDFYCLSLEEHEQSLLTRKGTEHMIVSQLAGASWSEILRLYFRGCSSNNFVLGGCVEKSAIIVALHFGQELLFSSAPSFQHETTVSEGVE